MVGLDDKGNTSRVEPAWLMRWLGFSLFGQGATQFIRIHYTVRRDVKFVLDCVYQLSSGLNIQFGVWI